MKTYKITLEVQLPEDYNELAIDTAIADAIYENYGEIIDISEYEEVEELD